MKKSINWINIEDIPWKVLKEGIYVKVLSSDPETGTYTRLLKFDPGARTSEVSIHNFWEEVFVLKGSIIDETAGMQVREGFYICREPGTKHGPFKSLDGCLLLECTYR